MSFTDNELKLIVDTVLALQPVEVAVEALCCQNVNLCIVEVTLKFMLDELMN